MKYYIVRGTLDWADEIDFDGFDLLTEDELKDAIKQFSPGGAYHGKTVNAYLGSNEDTEVEAYDVLYDLKEADEITEAQYKAIAHVIGYHFGVTNYGEFTDRADEIEENYDISCIEVDEEYGPKIQKLSQSDDEIEDEDPNGDHAPKLSESNWSECPYWDDFKCVLEGKNEMYTSWWIVDELITFNEDDYEFTMDQMKEIIDFFVDKANTRYVINDMEG